ASPFENASRQFANRGLILDQEHGFHHAGRWRGRDSHGRTRCNTAFRARQIDLERRSEARLAVHPDVSLALFDDAVRRREPKPGTVTRILRGEERLEEPALRLGRHADAVVT